jgi:undecaprenyl-diphosphatase
MIDIIQNTDVFLFHIVNRTIANPVFDVVMPFITSNANWHLVYLFLFGWLFWKGGKSGRICAVALIVAIVFVDQLNSSILKELFGRIRPCSSLADVRLLVGCGGGKSFPSSHAANTFAAAVVLLHYYKQYKWVYFSIAIAISFSRVYVGVHYMSDILGGAIVGSLSALAIIYIADKIQARYFA